RRGVCRVEPPLLEKLVKAIASLKEQVSAKELVADWEAFDRRCELAENYQERGDLAGSFREYCRAMRFLTEVFQRQRAKEEVFQPVWDKNDPLRPPTGSNGQENAAYRCEGCGKSQTVPRGQPTPTCCDRPMKRQG